MNPELCVVMPVYNEQESIASVLEEWHAAVRQMTESFLFILINDGSRDGCGPILDRLASQYSYVEIIHKENTGHGRSCRVGYERALAQGCQWVLQIDSDGQCDPRYFLKFWEVREGFDCVFGTRTHRGDGFTRAAISKACTLSLWLATGVRCGDANVPYRLLRSEVLAHALTHIPSEFNLQNIALTLWLKRQRNLRWHGIDIHFPERRGGVNSLNSLRAIRTGLAMLRELKTLRANSIDREEKVR